MHEEDKSYIDFLKNDFKVSVKVNREFNIILDETFEKITEVPGLKTKLFLHQQTIVKAMMDIENNKNFKKHNITYRVNAAVLAEPVGSGKTIEILTLIMMQSPKTLKNFSSIFGKFYYIKYKNIIPCNLIFVGTSVLQQWKKAIEKFTNLTYFAVGGIHELHKMLDMVNTGEIKKYNIVLVKNNTVCRVPDTFKSKIYNIKLMYKTKVHMFDIISSYNHICWSRVIIDDYDVIKISKDSKIINGLFTWYISSTEKRPSRVTTDIIDVKTTTELLLHQKNRCFEILTNPLINNNVVLKNSDEFLLKSNNLPYPKFYIYAVKNANNRLIKTLSNLDIPHIEEVVEMLNSDALSEAADKLGVTAHSVVDIFDHILGKQYNDYKLSIQVLNFIDEQKGRDFSILPDPEEDKTYKKKDLLCLTQIDYNYKNINQFLLKYHEQYEEVKNNSYKIIKRVKENIQEGECPICMSDLDDEKTNIVILKCCNTVVCDSCCFTVIFTKNKYIGPCPNCRTDINIKELVFIKDTDIEYDTLLENFDEEKVTTIVMEEVKVNPGLDKDYNRLTPKTTTKTSVILDIIKNSATGQEISINIKNIMNGVENTEEEKTITNNKFLIFGNYDTVLNSLLESLRTLENFKVLQLGGNYKNISQIASDFNETENNCILVINSIKHCSGLNLQTASDVIFIHKIIDDNIESQVIGRAQRLYRKSQLRVHYVLYDNEISQMSHKFIY